MKRNRLTITIGLLLIIVFALWLVVFQVRQSEVALVTTFGNPTRSIEKPGAYLKWPWPVQRVHKFDQRIQDFETQDKFDESLTSDSHNLLCQLYIGWQIKDARVFFPKFASGTIAEPERASIAAAEKVLEGVVRTHKNAVIGQHVLADFVSTNTAQLKFDTIENEIMTAVAAQVQSNNYGIEIKYLGIKKLGFPESVTQSVFDRMKSERDVIISKTKNLGEAEASKIRTSAERTADEIVAVANGEATRIRGQGEAEAAKSFTIFQQNPDLEKFLLDLDALEQLMKNRATLIFDDSTSPFNLFRGYSTNSLNPRK